MSCGPSGHVNVTPEEGYEVVARYCYDQSTLDFEECVDVFESIAGQDLERPIDPISEDTIDEEDDGVDKNKPNCNKGKKKKNKKCK
jgi:hypothetical protein